MREKICIAFYKNSIKNTKNFSTSRSNNEVHVAAILETVVVVVVALVVAVVVAVEVAVEVAAMVVEVVVAAAAMP